MNSKKAKALRKMMKNWSNLTPDSGMPEHQYLEDTNKSSTVIVTKEELEAAGATPEDFLSADTDFSTNSLSSSKTPEKNSVYRVKTKTGPIRNDGKSLRGMYLHFKEELVKIEKSRR